MKKKILLSAMIFAVAFAANCKKAAEGAGDLKSAGAKYMSALETMVSGLEKATDGKEAAKILSAARETSEALEKQFPQLKNFDKEPAFADLQARHGELAMKMLTVLAAADDKFKSNPEFAEEMKKTMKTE